MSEREQNGDLVSLFGEVHVILRGISILSQNGNASDSRRLHQWQEEADGLLTYEDRFEHFKQRVYELMREDPELASYYKIVAEESHLSGTSNQ